MIFGPSVFDIMVNFREVSLFVKKEEVQQLCVVSLALNDSGGYVAASEALNDIYDEIVG